MHATHLLAATAALILGAHASNDGGILPSGGCCAVWDATQNICVEKMSDPGWFRTCHRFDRPPPPHSPDAVPAGCYIWRMKKHKCLEWGPGPADGISEPAAGPANDPDASMTTAWVSSTLVWAVQDPAGTTSTATITSTLAPSVVMQTVTAAASAGSRILVFETVTVAAST
ncbi:hypothetical protein LTR36_010926 [Oleoguttula mirabilis]|uniref:Uncharacterized protein n=1 Tax=Oleoguttula mirabilis TaxID=1507867 RepID=A0AAV9J4E7_9PEZI|nr:hypothetical protein LTR36_010926 [Oleoguttula mirabilis]